MVVWFSTIWKLLLFLDPVNWFWGITLGIFSAKLKVWGARMSVFFMHLLLHKLHKVCKNHFHWAIITQVVLVQRAIFCEIWEKSPFLAIIWPLKFYKQDTNDLKLSEKLLFLCFTGYRGLTMTYLWYSCKEKVVLELFSISQQENFHVDINNLIGLV